MIRVVGARGTVSNVDAFLEQLGLFAQKEQVVVQAVDARVVYGVGHLWSAAEHAVRSWKRGTNATKSLALEILLYAAGERQIQKAIRKMGVKPGTCPVAFVLVCSSAMNEGAVEQVVGRLLRVFRMTQDASVLEGDRETLKRFGITGLEIRTVPEAKYGDLILEKVAMVDVIK